MLSRKPPTALSALVAMVALAMAFAWLPAVAGSDDIAVRVRLQDEAGGAIPYVAVWSAVEIDPAHRRPSPALGVADLWRITLRHGALHDIVSRFGDKPLPALRIPVMGDGEGLFAETLSYEAETGAGNHYRRPDPLRFGYTFMKRGYLPGRASFSLPRNENRAEAVVTLVRNPAEALETQTYLQTFARLRYELSDSARNTAMTTEGQQRLTDLRTALGVAADLAEASGDKPAAAHIQARMRYLPSLTVSGGKIVGFSQGDANSPAAKTAIDKAYELAPDDLYVWMQTYLRRAQLPPAPTQDQKITAALAEVERLIAAHGDAVWPIHHVIRAGGHAMLGHVDETKRLLQAAAELEPCYVDWAAKKADLRLQMKLMGFSVPADW